MQIRQLTSLKIQCIINTVPIFRYQSFGMIWFLRQFPLLSICSWSSGSGQIGLHEIWSVPKRKSEMISQKCFWSNSTVLYSCMSILSLLSTSSTIRTFGNMFSYCNKPYILQYVHHFNPYLLQHVQHLQQSVHLETCWALSMIRTFGIPLWFQLDVKEVQVCCRFACLCKLSWSPFPIWARPRVSFPCKFGTLQKSFSLARVCKTKECFCNASKIRDGMLDQTLAIHTTRSFKIVYPCCL